MISANDMIKFKEFLIKFKDTNIHPGQKGVIDVITEGPQQEWLSDIVSRIKDYVLKNHINLFDEPEEKFVNNNFHINYLKELWGAYLKEIGKEEDNIFLPKKPIEHKEVKAQPSDKAQTSENLNNRSMVRMVRGEASKLLKCTTYMPRLKHKPEPDEPFDISKSEVAKWLVQQPDVLQYVFSRLKNSGFIVYDKDTNEWYGSNFVDKKDWSPNEF